VSSSTIVLASPGKFPHRFGSVCHEKPLNPLQDVPGPGKYNVWSPSAAGTKTDSEAGSDNGALVTQARAARLERGFGGEPRMELTDKVHVFVLPFCVFASACVYKLVRVTFVLLLIIFLAAVYGPGARQVTSEAG
jgi:hypothetical protein